MALWEEERERFHPTKQVSLQVWSAQAEGRIAKLEAKCEQMSVF